MFKDLLEFGDVFYVWHYFTAVTSMIYQQNTLGQSLPIIIYAGTGLRSQLRYKDDLKTASRKLKITIKFTTKGTVSQGQIQDFGKGGPGNCVPKRSIFVCMRAMFFPSL